MAGPGFDLKPVLDRNKRRKARQEKGDNWIAIIFVAVIFGGLCTSGYFFAEYLIENAHRSNRSQTIAHASGPLRVKVNKIERVVLAWNVPRPVKDWYLEQVRGGPYADLLIASTGETCPRHQMLPYHGENKELLYEFGMLPNCTPTIVPNERPPP